MVVDLKADPRFLAAGVLLDLAFGDPTYPAHPVRLMGWTLARFEALLRRIGWDGYAGGIALFFLVAGVWLGGITIIFRWLNPTAAAILHVFLVYSLLALRDLLRHGGRVERAAARGDVDAARVAISKLVGRDTSKMDGAACRRAAIESMSENLTDGFLSPLFWYALGGLPGLVLFKIVSTMDSMVGYKTPKYLRFGWCGARTDDLMNFVPARLTWLLLSLVALFLPRCSAGKAMRVGWLQHAVVPGPNSGWAEAAMAGAIQRRLVGPIWMNGMLVTEIWLGYESDPPAGQDGDFPHAAVLILATGLIGVAFAITALYVA